MTSRRVPQPRPWMNTGLAVSLAILTVAQGARMAAGGSQKNKTTDYPVKVIFLDRVGDAIASDGKGAYTDGVDGVTALIQPSVNNQFLLKFASGGRIRRGVNYAYTSPTATSCDGNVSDNPTGTVAGDQGYVDVLNVATMAVGSQIAKQGGFHTAAGTFRFADATKIDPVNPYHCGDLLVVTRTSATTWTVTTDVTPGQTYFNSVGTPVYTANPEEVGQTAQLDGAAFDGNYHMPFFLTISCLSTTNCPK